MLQQARRARAITEGGIARAVFFAMRVHEGQDQHKQSLTLKDLLAAYPELTE